MFWPFVRRAQLEEALRECRSLRRKLAERRAKVEYLREQLIKAGKQVQELAMQNAYLKNQLESKNDQAP